MTGCGRRVSRASRENGGRFWVRHDHLEQVEAAPLAACLGGFGPDRWPRDAHKVSDLSGRQPLVAGVGAKVHALVPARWPGGSGCSLGGAAFGQGLDLLPVQ